MFVARAGEATLARLERLAQTTCGADVAHIAGLGVAEISEVRTPCVCLHGEHSPFRPMCRELAQILPNCSMDEIPRAQHFAFQENPAEFVDRVERHFCAMAGLTPSAPTQPLDHHRGNVMT